MGPGRTGRGIGVQSELMAGLSDEELRGALETLPGWRLGDGELVKNYRFPTFRQAIAFIVRLADHADAMDHHPDLENHYDRVRVAVHTWNENAITAKDVELARRIESVAEASDEPPDASGAAT